ncbi:SRPBCC domain-containing protein [Streptomyces sp. NPDC059740]|uniref:SRPBCC domain-containing protein n=1 Tax=Streptomyces sp. NPDC059740 TaxID=3346926 RepID=UPI00365D286F
MEHEVYVPFPVDVVRQALTEPDRVARCLPGVQLDGDAGPGPLKGRLRLRVGNTSITYRGSLGLRIADQPRGADPARNTAGSGPADSADTTGEPVVVVLAIEATGTEARGEGKAEAGLTVRLRAGEDGRTVLACGGAVRSSGRLDDLPHETVEAAGRRLLDRFAEQLAVDLERTPVAETPGAWGGTAHGPSGAESAGGAAGDAAAASGAGESSGAGQQPAGPADEAAAEPVAPAESSTSAGDELGGELGDDLAEDLSQDMIAGLSGGEEGPADGGEPPAEAAHARRTMIGRSAEEVDHAPPRGRYAPVPGPDQSPGTAALRWAAPAAAVALASAVVVSRILRRRR